MSIFKNLFKKRKKTWSLLPHPFSLGWHVRSEAVGVAELLRRTCSPCLRPGGCPHELPWDTAMLRRSCLLRWRVRGHMEGKGVPQPTASTNCQTREWNHLGPSSPASSPAAHCGWANSPAQPLSSKPIESWESNSLFRQLHFRVVCYPAINNLYHWVFRNENLLTGKGRHH